MLLLEWLREQCAHPAQGLTLAWRMAITAQVPVPHGDRSIMPVWVSGLRGIRRDDTCGLIQIAALIRFPRFMV